MATDVNPYSDLVDEISRVEQFLTASNQVYLIELKDKTKVVFKPAKGEKPLWDFPDGNLWRREYLANHFLDLIGVKVPRTYLFKDQELGEGLILEFIDSDATNIYSIQPIDVQLEVGWRLSFQGVSSSNTPVALWHRDEAALRKIAISDLILNNADRKASHILKKDNNYYAIDHGLTFHADEKVRSIFWGWSGLSFDENEIAFLQRARLVWETIEYRSYISDNEHAVTFERIQRVLDAGIFPPIPNDRNVLPWPIG